MGYSGSRLGDGGMRGSSWWMEIVRIQDGVGGIGGWRFRECVMKKVGDVPYTFF
jgi:hypothetical protein